MIKIINLKNRGVGKRMIKVRSCKTCIYARLICDKKKQKEFVGCIVHGAETKWELKERLERVHYETPYGASYIGWMYKNIPFENNQEDYDTAAVKVKIKGHISHKDAVCDLWNAGSEFINRGNKRKKSIKNKNF